MRKKQGFWSKIKGMFFVAFIIYMIIVTIFGSWESWVAKCIEVIPCSQPIMYVISKIVGVTIKYSTGKLNYTVSAIIKDIISLSISSMLICIYNFKFRIGTKKSLKSFFIDKMAIPIIVAFITAIVITKIYDILKTNGNVSLIFFSVIGLAGTLCLVIGVISILNKNELVYAVMQVIFLIVKALVTTVASCSFVLAVLLIVSDKNMFSSGVKLLVISLIMLIGIGLMLDSTGVTSIVKDKFVRSDEGDSWF